MRQIDLFAEAVREQERRLQDIQQELELRKNHLLELREQLRSERERIIERVLPARYALRQCQVFPIP